MAGILLVDDDPGLLEVLAQALEDEGFGVRTAGGGLAALAAIEAEMPSVILLDLNMPAVDGHAVLRELRERTQERQPAVIAMSAGLGGAALLSADPRVYSFLPKPFDLDVLIGLVRSALAEAGAESEVNLAGGPREAPPATGAMEPAQEEAAGEDAAAGL